MNKCRNCSHYIFLPGAKSKERKVILPWLTRVEEELDPKRKLHTIVRQSNKPEHWDQYFAKGTNK